MHTQLDKFFCDSTIFIDKIMAEVTELNNKPGFASFIKQFFTRVLNHNIYGCNYVELHNIAIQTYSFIAKRQKQEIKVRLYNPSLKKDGWVSDYSILEILNQDMPFIIDSINVELQKQGITIHRIIHPILTIKRQKSGELIEVNDFDNNSTSNESIIHYQITKINTKELAKKIEANLLELLTIIRFAVEDWQVMLTRLQNVTANLVEHKTIESEVNHFLSWLSEDNFTFLGYKSFYKELKQPIATVSSEDLGIFKCHDLQLLTALDNEVVYLQKSSPQENFVIGKLNYTSHVHNHTNLDYIYIKTTKDNVTHVHFFIGLFTSILFYQSATLIPIIRQKLKAVITRSGFSPTSYSGKELITIINNIARDELFQISEDELLNVAMEVYSLLTCPKLRLFIRRNNLGNYVSCMIFMPSSAFNADISEKIQTRLEQYLSGQVINNYMQLTSMKLAYIHLIIIPNTSLSPQILDEQTLELELQQLAQQWTEELHINFTNRVDNYNTEYLFSQYKSAFPITYRETFNTSTAIEDILIISNHLPQEKIIFKLNTTDEQSINLKLYSLKDKIPLSNIMPILENMGFKIIDECVFLIKPLNIQDTVWVHNFRLAAFDSETIIRIASLTLNIESSLLQIFSKFVDNDGFNKLVVSAGLLWQQVNLIRAIAKYIKQTEFIYSQPYIEEVLSKNAVIIQLLISLFYQNFDPKRKKSDKAVLDLHKKLDNALRSVTITAEDHIMRRFIGTITAITRTNYFQNDEDGLAKTYISIKFDSTKVPNLPLPLPYAEVFVYSTQFEAIHLRGGKVARGGIRWSDRMEDFRTEVLGLMRAQMTKNAVIVPVGSKGGFIVRANPEELGRAEYLQHARQCYQNFLRGLLDITDNIIDGKVITPQNILRLDEDDPYLVVAADKGTATFSDLANSVSNEYNFWLGDAFASGGSCGYDHKVMAITARGAWISVERHFNELGLDIASDFTVIGIGDMAGDVFGNGMLLSNNIRLLGAFNHAHIFVDPNPDSKISFNERKRLFTLSGSCWMDYNPKLLSKGGRIYDRKAKILELTPEIQKCFAIKDDFVTGEQLIKILLTAKVDLLWNGGIGTYVKAETETNEQVSDKANDSLRINGAELQAKVVAEGGNLGFTQRGRIEYANNAGKINNDSIDNSAGVDCSDHEVNIKIALRAALLSGKLDQPSRQHILEQMTDDVAALVLRDNYLQNQALTIAEHQSHRSLDNFSRLIKILDSQKIFNRNFEDLPNAAELARRTLGGLGLVRPELAMLLAYSKMTIYHDLLNTDLPDDPYFGSDLLFYFPETMKNQFSAEIQLHPLRREIITTFVTNSMVNRLGISFFHLCKEDTGFKGVYIARIYTIVRDLFNLRPLWLEIETLDNNRDVSTQVELFIEVETFLQNTILWFLSNVNQPIKMMTLIDKFQENISELDDIMDQIITSTATTNVHERVMQLVVKKVPKTLASKIALLKYTSSSCDISSVASKAKIDVKTVGSIYFNIGAKFNFEWLHLELEKLNSDSYWNNLAFMALKNDLFHLQRKITESVLKATDKNDNALVFWSNNNSKNILRYENFINSLKLQENIDYSMLVIASKRIESLLIKI